MSSYLKHGDNTFSTGDTICEAFSDYFHSTFLASSTNYTTSVVDAFFEAITSLSSIHVEESQVHRLLRQLEPAKIARPNKLPAIFLMKCPETIAVPITILFRRSLTESVVPDV